MAYHHHKGQKKMGIVMKEFKKGTLHSGSGAKVTSRKQAIAIGMSEAGLSKKRMRKTRAGNRITSE